MLVIYHEKVPQTWLGILQLNPTASENPTIAVEASSDPCQTEEKPPPPDNPNSKIDHGVLLFEAKLSLGP